MTEEAEWVVRETRAQCKEMRKQIDDLASCYPPKSKERGKGKSTKGQKHPQQESLSRSVNIHSITSILGSVGYTPWNECPPAEMVIVDGIHVSQTANRRLVYRYMNDDKHDGEDPQQEGPSKDWDENEDDTTARGGSDKESAQDPESDSDEDALEGLETTDEAD